MTYEYDQQFVDGVLFGEKTCAVCGKSLPKTREHFTPDATCPDGFKRECRRCRSTQMAEQYRRRREEAKKTTQERT